MTFLRFHLRVYELVGLGVLLLHSSSRASAAVLRFIHQQRLV